MKICYSRLGEIHCYGTFSEKYRTRDAIIKQSKKYILHLKLFSNSDDNFKDLWQRCLISNMSWANALTIFYTKLFVSAQAVESHTDFASHKQVANMHTILCFKNDY